MIHSPKPFPFCKKCPSSEAFDSHKTNAPDEGSPLKRKNNESIISKGNAPLAITSSLLILLVLISIEFIDRIFAICSFLSEQEQTRIKIKNDTILFIIIN